MKRILAGAAVAVSLCVLSSSAQSDSRVAAPLPATMSAVVPVNVLVIGFEQKTYFDNPSAAHLCRDTAPLGV